MYLPYLRTTNISDIFEVKFTIMQDVLATSWNHFLVQVDFDFIPLDSGKNISHRHNCDVLTTWNVTTDRRIFNRFQIEFHILKNSRNAIF